MKKLFSVLLALCLLFSVFCLPISAGENLNDLFASALGRLDMYYEFNAHYVVVTLTSHFYSWEDAEKNDFEAIRIDGEAYEAELHKRFLVDDALLAAVRTEAQYDAATHTYLAEFLGGFGGSMEERVYRGFVKGENGRYIVYYETINYEFLDDVAPEDDPIWEQIDAEEWPYEVEYGGNAYESGPDGYYRIVSYAGTGNCYTVEYHEGTVRLVSSGTFGEGEMPKTFESGIVGVLVESGNTEVVIEAEGAFDEGTVVKIETATEQPTVTAAMNGRDLFTAFEITADRDGSAVQPSSPIAVTFPIPEAWGTTDVSVYYLNEEDSSLVPLVTVVDAEAKTATAELSHFSLYVLAEAPAESEDTSDDVPADSVPAATEGTVGSAPSAGTTGEGSAASTDGEDGTVTPMFLIPMAVAVVIAAVAVGFVLAKKKK